MSSTRRTGWMGWIDRFCACLSGVDIAHQMLMVGCGSTSWRAGAERPGGADPGGRGKIGVAAREKQRSGIMFPRANTPTAGTA